MWKRKEMPAKIFWLSKQEFRKLCTCQEVDKHLELCAISGVHFRCLDFFFPLWSLNQWNLFSRIMLWFIISNLSAMTEFFLTTIIALDILFLAIIQM